MQSVMRVAIPADEIRSICKVSLSKNPSGLTIEDFKFLVRTLGLVIYNRFPALNLLVIYNRFPVLNLLVIYNRFPALNLLVIYHRFPALNLLVRAGALEARAGRGCGCAGRGARGVIRCVQLGRCRYPVAFVNLPAF
jgi:hypothetical protein